MYTQPPLLDSNPIRDSTSPVHILRFSMDVRKSNGMSASRARIGSPTETNMTGK